MTIAVTVDDIRPILRAHDLGEAVALTEIAGGSAQTFRIDLADGGSLGLKTYPDDRPWVPGKDAYAAGLLRGLDLPVTRYLATDDSKTRLPAVFAITNWLPGETADALKGAPDIAGVHRQMGALLKTLHGVAMPGYGRIDAKGVVRPVATNEEFLRATFAETFDKFRLHGGDPALADKLAAVVADRFDAMVPSQGPVFAHDDVHPGNVLASRGADGRLRLSGLIDFGNAHAADAVYDLAKCIFISEHMAPGCGAAMRDGYGPIDHPDAEGALWTYTLLHRMMMWWWIRSIGGKADEGSLPALMRDIAAMVG